MRTICLVAFSRRWNQGRGKLTTLKIFENQPLFRLSFRSVWKGGPDSNFSNFSPIEYFSSGQNYSIPIFLTTVQIRNGVRHMVFDFCISTSSASIIRFRIGLSSRQLISFFFAQISSPVCQSDYQRIDTPWLLTSSICHSVTFLPLHSMFGCILSSDSRTSISIIIQALTDLSELSII